MSWIEKELRRRAAESGSPKQAENPSATEFSRMADMWAMIKRGNSALPVELQLEFLEAGAFPASAEDIECFEWLVAPNGAALGFTGDGIRYIWPETSPRRSNNFWIRWNTKRQIPVLVQRMSDAFPPDVAEYRFDDTRIDYMLKCLVLGGRIKARSIKKKRLWLL